MDCRIARLLLEFERPLHPELPGDDAEALKAHLAECPECGPLARAERQADNAIGQAMRAVPIPEGLRERLVARLERPGRGGRRWPWWAGGAAAAAAVAAVAVWLGMGGFPPRAQPDLVETSYKISQQQGAPPDQVEEWFRGTYGLHTVAPTQFNNKFLAFYDLSDFGGKRVPMLMFIRGDGSRARVYILGDDQFDLQNVQAQNTTGYNIRVLSPQADPHIAYVVYYSQDPLELFLNGDDKNGSGT